LKDLWKLVVAYQGLILFPFDHNRVIFNCCLILSCKIEEFFHWIFFPSLKMEKTVDYEGGLLVEVFKIYEEMYCCISGRTFQAFKKSRPNASVDSSNKAELALQVCCFVFVNSSD
jgi:hypothetical protein